MPAKVYDSYTYQRQSPEQAVKLRPTITISLCLNLVLVSAAVQLLKRPASRTPRDSAATVSEVFTAPSAASLPAASNPPAPTHLVTNRFGWNVVEAEDLEQLAANQRAIGCPEKTVRDVVGARARRGLDRLARSAEPKLPFWTAGLRRVQAQRDAERVVAAARAKLLASVERALGRDVFIEDGKLMEDFVEQAIVRFLSGPLAEEKFSRLAGLLVRQQALMQEVRACAHGVLLEEDQAALKILARQFHQELAALLLPAELEEFTARPAMMKLADDVRFDATDLSPAEIRAVAIIRARSGNPMMGEWFEGGSLTDQQEAQAALAVREFLGESRYAQVERAADGAFKKLFDLGRDNKLPRAAAVQAFEVCQLTAQEVARLREDNSLSAMERQQQLASVQTQAQAGVLKVLGAEACAEYLNRGGAWLTNVSGL
jgi:hypothetical protein